MACIVHYDANGIEIDRINAFEKKPVLVVITIRICQPSLESWHGRFNHYARWKTL